MAIIFTFGSNMLGIHGKGAAFTALKKYGAIYGQGEGRQGLSYAIPTKKTPYITLPLDKINQNVQKFIQYATEHADDTFILTRIGCGLAGYKDQQIAPMFKTAPTNVNIPDEWKDILGISSNELTMDELFNDV